MTPAFKEWSYIVEALGTGKQNIIIRKGGIHEEGSDFEIRTKKFLLFPTLFHQAKDLVKSDWFEGFDPDKFHKEQDKVRVEYFAEIADSRIITEWDMLVKLYPFHAWSEGIIKERFERWEKRAHLLIVQIYKLNEPQTIELLPEYGGCKSWVDLEGDFKLEGKPVINKMIR